MMMRKTSLILLGAAAGVAVTLIATQPRIVFDGARAQAAASGTFQADDGSSDECEQRDLFHEPSSR